MTNCYHALRDNEEGNENDTFLIEKKVGMEKGAKKSRSSKNDSSKQNKYDAEHAKLDAADKYIRDTSNKAVRSIDSNIAKETYTSRKEAMPEDKSLNRRKRRN